jgi:hypothetical protein
VRALIQVNQIESLRAAPRQTNYRLRKRRQDGFWSKPEVSLFDWPNGQSNKDLFGHQTIQQTATEIC